ncbi:carbon-nitrogen hydrolase family protein [Aldersonia sp. NBC_00410]|uniref:carbon-nitrogen hydrolase family protein n=1 Tax=Aldersonia sp. NBC_00410 TaxID=2975954 RepID=UPI0022508F9C|nr:carbon-nitrogen hydrolase family protein [Aldersonia sp. NBC_00410]MCX5043691.1 carbon-nitrogen hydrolase family protein [Aldersonia sp. NBC_00410]
MSTQPDIRVPIAVAQFAPRTDKDANLAEIRRLTTEAAGDGARLVVAPEYSMFTGRKLDAAAVAAAEPLDGPFVTGLSAIAQELAVYLVAGMNESVPGEDRFSNTLVALAPDGSLITVYRKLHLYDAFGFTESDVVRPGDIVEPATFPIDGIVVGLQTCYDVRFPEVTRRLVDAGAGVVALPAQWIPGPLKEDHWATLVRARAIENTVYIAAADQSAPSGAGGSIIVDPMGVPMAALGERTGTVTATVSSHRLDEVRLRNPALELRRLR